MSETQYKSAYCPNCTKNVPHHRDVKGAITGAIDSYVGGALEAMRIGPWYCLHCQRRNLLLHSPRKDAQDYRIVDPLDPLEPGAVNIWSPAVTDDDIDSYLDLSGDEDEYLDFLDEDLTSKPNDWVIELEEVDNGLGQLEKYIPVEMVGDKNEARVTGQKLPSTSEDFEELASHDETQDRESDSMISKMQNAMVDPAEAPIAKRGNGPEKMMRSTRMHRVSVKYRDSVVDRILAGKVSISELDESDEYSEAELVCWIADKFKRMKQQLEELQANSNGRVNERGPASGGFGPFGAR